MHYVSYSMFAVFHYLFDFFKLLNSQTKTLLISVLLGWLDLLALVDLFRKFWSTRVEFLKSSLVIKEKSMAKG